MAWSAQDGELVFPNNASQDAVALIRFVNGDLEVEVCAGVELLGRLAVVRNLHVYGQGPNTVGRRLLLSLATWVKDYLDVEELRVEGAPRATGANPGRKPAPLVF